MELRERFFGYTYHVVTERKTLDRNTSNESCPSPKVLPISLPALVAGGNTVKACSDPEINNAKKQIKYLLIFSPLKSFSA
ncbi:MAG TPA: hypothetical protein VJ112_01435 [Rhabdochlamydiaceae bacterium]|nr:hypothetical protein [Rhabdochlamydiaceae bacterium]